MSDQVDGRDSAMARRVSITDRRIFALMALALASPCAALAATPPQADGAGEGVVTWTERGPSPDFLLSKPRLVSALGLPGQLANIQDSQEDGRTLVAEDGVANPAAALAHDTAEAFAEGRGLKLAATAEVVSAAMADPGALIAGSSGARYVVDVETRAWGLWYLPWNPTRYRLMYSARLQVLDASTGRAIATGSCVPRDDKEAHNLPLKQFTDNGAAELKAALKAAADGCLAKWLQGPLKLRS